MRKLPKIIEQPHYSKPFYNKTLVIDNGTDLLKAGYSGFSPQIVFPNYFYKTKQYCVLSKQPQSTFKTCFENDVVINTENLEILIDFVMSYLVFEHRGKNFLISNCSQNQLKNVQNEFEDENKSEIGLSVRKNTGKITGFATQVTKKHVSKKQEKNNGKLSVDEDFTEQKRIKKTQEAKRGSKSKKLSFEESFSEDSAQKHLKKKQEAKMGSKSKKLSFEESFSEDSAQKHLKKKQEAKRGSKNKKLSFEESFSKDSEQKRIKEKREIKNRKFSLKDSTEQKQIKEKREIKNTRFSLKDSTEQKCVQNKPKINKGILKFTESISKKIQKDENTHSDEDTNSSNRKNNKIKGRSVQKLKSDCSRDEGIEERNKINPYRKVISKNRKNMIVDSVNEDASSSTNSNVDQSIDKNLKKFVRKTKRNQAIVDSSSENNIFEKQKGTDIKNKIMSQESISNSVNKTREYIAGENNSLNGQKSSFYTKTDITSQIIQNLACKTNLSKRNSVLESPERIKTGILQKTTQSNNIERIKADVGFENNASLSKIQQINEKIQNIHKNQQSDSILQEIGDSEHQNEQSDVTKNLQNLLNQSQGVSVDKSDDNKNHDSEDISSTEIGRGDYVFEINKHNSNHFYAMNTMKNLNFENSNRNRDLYSSKNLFSYQNMSENYEKYYQCLTLNHENIANEDFEKYSRKNGLKSHFIHKDTLTNKFNGNFKELPNNTLQSNLFNRNNLTEKFSHSYEYLQNDSSNSYSMHKDTLTNKFHDNSKELPKNTLQSNLLNDYKFIISFENSHQNINHSETDHKNHMFSTFYRYKNQSNSNLQNSVDISKPTLQDLKNKSINPFQIINTLRRTTNTANISTNKQKSIKTQQKSEDSTSCEDYSVSESEETFSKKLTENEIKNYKARVPKELILTDSLFTPKLFQIQKISMLFEVFQFERIQIGLDCVYSYLINVDSNLRATNELKFFYKQSVFSFSADILSKTGLSTDEKDFLIENKEILCKKYRKVDLYSKYIDKDNLNSFVHKDSSTISSQSPKILCNKKGENTSKNSYQNQNNRISECFDGFKQFNVESIPEKDSNIFQFKLNTTNECKNTTLLYTTPSAIYAYPSPKDLIQQPFFFYPTVFTEIDLIISIGHTCTLLIAIQSEKIIGSYKIPYAYKSAKTFLTQSLSTKNIYINDEEIDELMEKSTACLDYEQECLDIINNVDVENIDVDSVDFVDEFEDFYEFVDFDKENVELLKTFYRKECAQKFFGIYSNNQNAFLDKKWYVKERPEHFRIRKKNEIGDLKGLENIRIESVDREINNRHLEEIQNSSSSQIKSDEIQDSKGLENTRIESVGREIENRHLEEIRNSSSQIKNDEIQDSKRLENTRIESVDSEIKPQDLEEIKNDFNEIKQNENNSVTKKGGLLSNNFGLNQQNDIVTHSAINESNIQIQSEYNLKLPKFFNNLQKTEEQTNTSNILNEVKNSEDKTNLEISASMQVSSSQNHIQIVDDIDPMQIVDQADINQIDIESILDINIEKDNLGVSEINNLFEMNFHQKMLFFKRTPETKLSEIELKEKRKINILFKMGIARYNLKIRKVLQNMKKRVEITNQKHKIMLNLPKYIAQVKESYTLLKNELKNRKKLRENSSTWFTKEHNLLNLYVNDDYLDKTSQDIILDIKLAENQDLELLLKRKLFVYHNFLLKNGCENFLKTDSTKNKWINLTAEIDLVRIVEALFKPSVVYMKQKGICEILEDLSSHKIKNVFITGGYGVLIHNLDKRIELEVNCRSKYGNTNVIVAKDGRFDSFRGAQFSKAFPIYTIEDYKKYGAEIIQ